MYFGNFLSNSLKEDVMEAKWPKILKLSRKEKEKNPPAVSPLKNMPLLGDI